jgi:prepilin-type N-terminal cleavage/methylation domain-containing protein
MHIERSRRAGLSLLELVAAITILGILASLVLPRFGASTARAKREMCHTNKLNIEVQTQLWFRSQNAWPSADLSDVGADPRFFPEAIPVCPVDGSAYTIDSATGRVVGHEH